MGSFTKNDHRATEAKALSGILSRYETRRVRLKAAGLLPAVFQLTLPAGASLVAVQQASVALEKAGSAIKSAGHRVSSSVRRVTSKLH